MSLFACKLTKWPRRSNNSKPSAVSITQTMMTDYDVMDKNEFQNRALA